VRGCLPTLEETYKTRLVRNNFLLGVEILICIIILIEITIVALAFAIICDNHKDEESSYSSIRIRSQQSIESFDRPMTKRSTSVFYETR
jgi:hypothetical protein